MILRSRLAVLLSATTLLIVAVVRVAVPASAALPGPVSAITCPAGQVREVEYVKSANGVLVGKEKCVEASTGGGGGSPGGGGSTGSTRPAVTTTTRPVSDDRFLTCSFSWVQRSGSSWLPVATRADAARNGAGSSARARICLGPVGVSVDTATLIWVLPAAGGEDPTPGLSIAGQIEEFERMIDFGAIGVTLNPVDPLRQILFLPTWIVAGTVAELTPAPISLTSSITGDTATASAVPRALLFTPGDGNASIRCAATNGRIGVPWKFGDDRRLNSDPTSVPGACRYRYEKLPKGNATFAAQITMEYEITYVGLTGAAGPVVDIFVGSPTPVTIDVIEQVAVNTPNSGISSSGN